MQGTLKFPLVGCKFCDMPLLNGNSDTCRHCASLEAIKASAGFLSHLKQTVAAAANRLTFRATLADCGNGQQRRRPLLG